jgi:hypothetical protein
VKKMNAYHRWPLTLLILVALTVVPVLGAGAVMFTMNPTQLQALYEVYENPNLSGTYLSGTSPGGNAQALPNGAKYRGDIGGAPDYHNGWAQIQIGANFWGKPFGGSNNQRSSNVALGMGSLSGYDSYALLIENVNENPWKFNLFFNVGYTDWGETNYYVQNSWTSFNVNEQKSLVLDFTNAQVWGGDGPGGDPDYNGNWIDLTNAAAFPVDWTHISNIGFNIGENVPIGSPADYTYEAHISPIPEPSTIILLGFGFLGLAAYGWRRKKKSKAS